MSDSGGHPVRGAVGRPRERRVAGAEEAAVPHAEGGRGLPLTIVWEVALATGLWRARSMTAVRGRAVTTEGKGKAAGKTHAAHRDVPIGPSTVALLRAHKIAQAPGATHVFTDAEGEAVHPDRMSKRFTRPSGGDDPAQWAGAHEGEARSGGDPEDCEHAGDDR